MRLKSLKFRLLLISKLSQKEKVLICCLWRKIRTAFRCKGRQYIQTSRRRSSYMRRVLEWIVWKKAVHRVVSVILIVNNRVSQFLLAVCVDMRVYDTTWVLIRHCKQIFLFQNLLCTQSCFLLFWTKVLKMTYAFHPRSPNRLLPYLFFSFEFN